tara:strand:+ start:19 stop:135 length:117 start_codon:yes stop_codon:yes gene_type:complete
MEKEENQNTTTENHQEPENKTAKPEEIYNLCISLKNEK